MFTDPSLNFAAWTWLVIGVGAIVFAIAWTTKTGFVHRQVPAMVTAEHAEDTVPIKTWYPLVPNIPSSVTNALLLDRKPWDDDAVSNESEPDDDDPSGDTDYGRWFADLPEDARAEACNPPYRVNETFLHSVLRSQPWPSDRWVGNLRGETTAWRVNDGHHRHAAGPRHGRNQGSSWVVTVRQFVSRFARAGGRT